MLDAAYGSFADLGYRATTMQEIADRADVAVQTLYFTFHTKDQLLQAVQDRAVLGDDGIPPHLQPWFATMRRAESVEAAVDAFSEGLTGICARVAPLIPTFHAVAADPAGEVWRESERLRRDGFKDILQLWNNKARLREGLTKAVAVDLLVVLAGPELYRSLTADCGWTPAAYRAWLARTLRRELFDLA
jgi:AcrR family transcriptional regulator